ncbi:MAG: 50S ribosomal protein L3 [Candidatus Micrarchaeota archaeon]
MPKKSRPRTGSLAIRPRKRAKKETPSFATYSKTSVKNSAVNFMGYKAGMLHLLVKNETPKTTSFGQEISLPVTVIECPPLKVFGLRAYTTNLQTRGTRVLMEVNAEKTDVHLGRKIKSFRKKHGKEQKNSSSKTDTEKKKHGSRSLEDLEKNKSQIVGLRLLVHTQIGLTNTGRKKPDVSEIALNGSIDEQLAFAKQKLGHELSVSDVLEKNQLIDIKAVTKGKGMQGVIKRHRVKMQRHKAKNTRTVGAISPWHPPTVMWTVARPGQMGYHNRTEFNKRIVQIANPKQLNVTPKGGFSHYGVLQNEYVLVAGSIAGPPKRCIALRPAVRPFGARNLKLGEISNFSTMDFKSENADEPIKAHKVVLEKTEKAVHKSVEDELKEATKVKA